MSQSYFRPNTESANTARPIYRSTERLWRSNFRYTTENSINPEADDIEEIKLGEEEHNTKKLLS